MTHRNPLPQTREEDRDRCLCTELRSACADHRLKQLDQAQPQPQATAPARSRRRQLGARGRDPRRVGLRELAHWLELRGAELLQGLHQRRVCARRGAER